MILYIIFGQRKEQYIGEYAPEALEVMSEYDYDENPKWLQDKLEEYRKNTDFLGVSAFEVKLPAGTLETIRDVLLQVTDTIEATSVEAFDSSTQNSI